MLGGVVSYVTQAKRDVLGVEGDVVTADAAMQMATSVRALFGADVGVGVTGVAGPERQEGQPVGTVFVAWAVPEGTRWCRLACAGAPDQIRREVVEQALALVRDAVRGDRDPLS
jgi:nicotinamide-nucleotide amidase